VSEAGAIPVQRIGGNLLVTVHVELDDRLAEALQRSVLVAIEAGGSNGLIIDISGLEVVDSYVARVLVDTGRMARLMGVATVLAGMRPEVAATLVRMGYAMEGVRTALDVDHALEQLRKVVRG
jgi:rsbT antagonist protein RsbS